MGSGPPAREPDANSRGDPGSGSTGLGGAETADDLLVSDTWSLPVGTPGDAAESDCEPGAEGERSTSPGAIEAWFDVGSETRGGPDKRPWTSPYTEISMATAANARDR